MTTYDFEKLKEEIKDLKSKHDLYIKEKDFFHLYITDANLYKKQGDLFSEEKKYDLATESYLKAIDNQISNLNLITRQKVKDKDVLERNESYILSSLKKYLFSFLKNEREGLQQGSSSKMLYKIDKNLPRNIYNFFDRRFVKSILEETFFIFRVKNDDKFEKNIDEVKTIYNFELLNDKTHQKEFFLIKLCQGLAKSSRNFFLIDKKKAKEVEIYRNISAELLKKVGFYDKWAEELFERELFRLYQINDISLFEKGLDNLRKFILRFKKNFKPNEFQKVKNNILVHGYIYGLFLLEPDQIHKKIEYSESIIRLYGSLHNKATKVFQVLRSFYQMQLLINELDTFQEFASSCKKDKVFLEKNFLDNYEFRGGFLKEDKIRGILDFINDVESFLKYKTDPSEYKKEKIKSLATLKGDKMITREASYKILKNIVNKTMGRSINPVELMMPDDPEVSLFNLREIVREDDRNEFKSTIRLNLERYINTKEKILSDSKIKEEFLKSIVGFLNSKGGNLIIGVSEKNRLNGYEKLEYVDFGDNRILIGIEKDEFKDDDDCVNFIADLVSSHIDKNIFKEIKIKYYKEGGLTSLLIQVPQGKKWYFLDDETFYLREGNRTSVKSGRALLDYQKSHSRS